MRLARIDLETCRFVLTTLLIELENKLDQNSRNFVCKFEFLYRNEKYQNAINLLML